MILISNFKKLSALILAFAVLCCVSVPAVLAAEADLPATESAENAYNFMMAVGAMDPEEVDFDASMVITRAHFVKLALHLSNDAPKVIVPNSGVFTDVTPSIQYADYIETAYRIGYISGSASGVFEPDAAITLPQALKILCNILGYQRLAEANGGYPSGYLITSQRIGLLTGVSAQAESTLNMADAVILMKNALEADLMEITGFGEDVEMEARDGLNLLTERHGVELAQGVITATAYTELYSQNSGLEPGEIKLGGKTYSVALSNAENYVGYDVELYYDSSSQKNVQDVLWVEASSENRIFQIENLKEFEAEKDVIYITDESGNTKRVTISADATYLVNGKMKNMSCEDLHDVEKGSITLISNNGDSLVDIVNVKKYDTYVVAGTSPMAEIITARDGSVISLESDTTGHTVSLSKDGYPTVISEIHANDVIVVAESVGDGFCHKEVIVCDMHMEGSFEEIGDGFAVMEGESYNVDLSVISDINLGSPYTVRFDAFGNIAHIDSIRDYVYGYLYGITKQGFADPVCRIFTEMNRWVDLNFYKTVEYNGKKVSGEALYEELASLEDECRQLIRYKVNTDGELVFMQTAQKILLGSENEIEAYENNSFRISYEGSLYYSNTAGSLGGVVFAGDNAKIFVVPDDMDRRNFKIMKKSRLVPNKFYPMTAYDVDKYLNCDIAIISSDIAADTASVYTDKFMVVDSIGSILDSEGDVAVALRGYWKGSYLSFAVKIGEGGVSEELLNSLKRGDVILFKYDDRSNINFINKYELTNGFYKPANTHADQAVLAGKIVECNFEKRRMRFKYSPSDPDVTLDYTASTTFYLYNISDETYTIASAQEVLPDDIVFVNTRYFRCYDVVIIRK